MKNEDDPNSLLILRESSERKSLRGNYGRSPSRNHEDEPEKGRFETLSIKSIDDKSRFKKFVQTDTQNNATADKRAQEEKERQEAARKSRAQTEEQNMRNQARDLRNQIEWWKSQRGHGTHDECTIDGQISSLESQLNGIPAQFWF